MLAGRDCAQLVGMENPSSHERDQPDAGTVPPKSVKVPHHSYRSFRDKKSYITLNANYFLVTIEFVPSIAVS